MTADDGATDRMACRRPVDLSDDVFATLSHTYRRYTLYFLLEHDSVSLEELADVVTGWTHAQEYGMVGRSTRDGIATELLHRHLPRMDSARLVSFDRESGSVTRSNWSDSVDEFLRLVHDAETATGST